MQQYEQGEYLNFPLHPNYPRLNIVSLLLGTVEGLYSTNIMLNLYKALINPYSEEIFQEVIWKTRKHNIVWKILPCKLNTNTSKAKNVVMLKCVLLDLN